MMHFMEGRWDLVYNPATKRYVKVSGKKGRELLPDLAAIECLQECQPENKRSRAAFAKYEKERQAQIKDIIKKYPMLE
jgi:hypothetical protein